MKKTFKINKKGKIEFTKEELKKLLDEIYNEGYREGSLQYYTYTTPWNWDHWYTNPTTITTNTTTINTDITGNTATTNQPLYKDQFTYINIGDDCIYSNEE